MRIGIDISQLAFPKTGVANYLHHLVEEMIHRDHENEYILFFSSMRQPIPTFSHLPKNVHIKHYKIPPTILAILWNTFHIIPVEWFTGPLDIFISSDWTQPPTKAKKVTILYDLIVYKYPQETANNIVSTQKKRLSWVKKEIDRVLCISEATKRDAIELLDLAEKKCRVVYPGVTI